MNISSLAKIAGALVAPMTAILLFSGCLRQADPTLGREMRDAYYVSSRLYGYVWRSDLFFDSKHEAEIASLIKQLSSDFHRIEVKAPIEMFEPGFTVTLQAQRELLSDIEKRFEQGSKEYAQWRLQSVSQNCIACHSRFNAPIDFIGAPPQPVNGSFEAQFSVAKFLFATRQFEQASEKLLALAQSVGSLESGGGRAFRALQLYLAIQVRVKSRYAKAAQELSTAQQKLRLSSEQSEAVSNWIRELGEFAKDNTPRDIYRAEAYLHPVWSIELEDNDNIHLASTLAASSILHELLLSSDQSLNRRRASLLLAVSYMHLPIDGFEGFPLLYLEQCIREFPNTDEAREAFNFYEMIVQDESTGSGGVHLDKEERRKLIELRELAYGSAEPPEDLPFAKIPMDLPDTEANLKG